jgi:hypothetical protein
VSFRFDCLFTPLPL